MRFNNDEEREKYFEDGELTQIAEEQTYLFDYEDDDVYKYSAKYIEEISANNFFVDYLKRYIGINKDRINFCGDIESLDDIFSFLKTCYAKEGIKGDRGKGKYSYNPSLVKKWIYEGMIPSRPEAHRLCFCLEMDIKTAEELLLKFPSVMTNRPSLIYMAPPFCAVQFLIVPPFIVKVPLSI